MKLRKERRRDRKKDDEASQKSGNESKHSLSGRQRRDMDVATYQELIMDSDDEDRESDDMNEADEMSLRDDGDAPINLLDSKAAIHLFNSKSAAANKRKGKKQTQKKTKFAKDGRMIVNMEEDVKMTLDSDNSSGDDTELTSLDDLKKS